MHLTNGAQLAQEVVHSSFTINKHYPAAPERVFEALANPAKKRRWFAEGEESRVDEFQMEFRVGGRERTRYRSAEDSPLKGAFLTNESLYQDIVQDRRVVLASTMAVGDRRISASLTTFELVASGNGTDLVFTEQVAFFEGADGAQMREQGWRQLLSRLETAL